MSSTIGAAHFWIIVPLLSLAFILLLLRRIPATLPTEAAPSSFAARPFYDLAAVHPNEVISSIPRIRKDRINDISPNCLKHPSNAVDQDCWNSFRRHQYLEVLQSLYTSSDEDLARFKNSQNWQIFDLISPTYVCDFNSLRRVGSSGDGGKWLCGPIRVTHGPKCVIFSLGSNNQFDFEEAIDHYAGGKCEIHTFDCTGNWSNPHTTFHSWCLGSFDGVDGSGKTFKRLSTAAKELGVTSISLLKMDIEHAEYQVFDGLKNEPEDFLPDQIMFELHTGSYPSTSKHKNDWPRTIIGISTLWDIVLPSKRETSIATLDAVFCSEYVIVRDRPSTINPKGSTH